MAGIRSFTNNLKISPPVLSTRRLLFLYIILTVSFYDAFSREYFQQEVNYNIIVSLNDTSHELPAFETIEYINHSPDTLHFIYFHLWPNAYSDNNTPLAKQVFRMNGKSKLFNDPELKGFIDSLDFQVNGRQVQWNLLADQPDICRVNLNEPLKAGDTILITTPFHVKIPKGVTSRLGHIGESYQISQWYPKPAVYDRDGWHPMSYLDQGEFYSKFGSFDVRITLPGNYIVGATGNLQNRQEIEMLEKITDENLDWFFTDLLGTTKRLDYKMVRIKNNQLLIKNNGELVSPLVIAGTKEDSIFFERWIDGFAGKKWIPLPDGDYTEIKIDTGHEMPEIFRIKSGYLEYFRNLCSIPGFQKY